MRYLLIAAAIAVSAPIGLGSTAALADTTKVIIKDGHRNVHRRVVERHGPRCMSKKVVTYRHGERIVRTTRVCR